MKQFRLLAFPLASVLLVLVGCAAPPSKYLPGKPSECDPIFNQLGPDTWTAKRGYGGCYGEPVLGALPAFCKAQGKLPLVLRLRRDSYYANEVVDLDFRCLTADDPEYQRPTLRPTPNTSIEVR